MTSGLSPEEGTQDILEKARVKINSKWSDVIDGFSSMAIGVLAFLVTTGPKVLDTKNIGWLTQGDGPAFYAGSLFYLRDVLRNPVGANPTYGLDFSSSILNSDSIPLLAIPIKLLGINPEQPFQYFGIWMLLCFGMQGLLGLKLGKLVGLSRGMAIVGSGFFSFAPVFISRHQMHYALGAHFLILAAIYLTLRRYQNFPSIKWAILLAISIAVNPYLFVMSAAFWTASAVMLGISQGRQERIRLAAVYGATLAVLMVEAWQIGYFLTRSPSAGGYGYYKSNLLTLIDADGWSNFLPNLPPAGEGEYEGFAYLGLGMLIIFLAIGYSRFVGRVNLLPITQQFKIAFYTSIGFALYAVSNHIAVGSFELVIPIPELIEPLFGVFRSSGRMIWPFVYLIMLLAIANFSALFISRSGAIYVLTALLVVQIGDASPAWRNTKTDRFVSTEAYAWPTGLVSEKWESFAEKYSELRLVPPGNISENWRDLSYFAGNNGLSTDAVYLARPANKVLEEVFDREFKDLVSGNLKVNTLYIVNDQLFEIAKYSVNREIDSLMRVDGLNILAPNFRPICRECRLLASDLLPAPTVNTDFGLSKNAVGTRYLVRGWSEPEDSGTWSNGKKAYMFIPSSGLEKELVITGVPYVEGSLDSQNVKIYSGDAKIGEFEFNSMTQTQMIVDLHPHHRTKMRNGTALILEFQFDAATSPHDLGINNDYRKLAFRLTSIELRN